MFYNKLAQVLQPVSFESVFHIVALNMINAL